MATFNFEKTIERDIDRIICEELYSFKEFLDIFTESFDVTTPKQASPWSVASS